MIYKRPKCCSMSSADSLVCAGIPHVSCGARHDVTLGEQAFIEGEIALSGRSSSGWVLAQEGRKCFIFQWRLTVTLSATRLRLRYGAASPDGGVSSIAPKGRGEADARVRSYPRHCCLPRAAHRIPAVLGSGEEQISTFSLPRCGVTQASSWRRLERAFVERTSEFCRRVTDSTYCRVQGLG